MIVVNIGGLSIWIHLFGNKLLNDISLMTS